MFLVDSGVWIGASNPKDGHHREAARVLRAISSGEFGKVFITDLIFSEVVTYIRRKVGKMQSSEVARMLLDSERVEIRFVDEHTFSAAYHLFERYPDLSFTDAASVVMMKDLGIRQIISFDRGFDSVRDIVRLETVAAV